MNPSLYSSTNYMVPAGGTTHAVEFKGVFTTVPLVIDWRQYKIDNFPFQPQGVFIDNTAGTTPLVLVIGPLNWTITVPAGGQLQTQFPAPNGQTCSITGDPDNVAQVIFVDFPVLSQGGGGGGGGGAGGDVTVVNDAGSPVPVVLESSGAPLSVLPLSQIPQINYQNIVVGDNDCRFAPTGAHAYLRKIVIVISPDASIGVTGLTTLSILNNISGITAYKQNIFLQAAPVIGTSNFGEKTIELDFSNMLLDWAGATIFVRLGAALTAGNVDCNFYFTSE